MIELLVQHPVLAALVALALLAVVFGALLGFASERFAVDEDPIVEQILDKLPQTQCGQCGYPGCRAYAEAIAAGDVINKCPPGGQTTINALATLLNVEAPALDAEHGTEKPPMVAFIHEDACIGCTKCIQACPVDAILGAAKQMHTVISSECTGCDLCVEPCPVDCIEMIPVPTTTQTWRWELPQRESTVALQPTRMQVIATDTPRPEHGA